jgi:hypothetical protein
MATQLLSPWTLFMMFRNAFLSALSTADAATLTPRMTEVVLGVGQVLCEAGALPDNVYFPSGAVLSGGRPARRRPGLRDRLDRF